MACIAPDRTAFETRFPVATYPQFDTATLDAFFASNAAIFCCYYNKPFGTDTCTDESIFLVIAHLITLDQKSTTNTSSVKDVASKSVEGVSITYATTGNTSESDAFFNSTVYGQKFLQINRFNHGGVFV